MGDEGDEEEVGEVRSRRRMRQAGLKKREWKGEFIECCRKKWMQQKM